MRSQFVIVPSPLGAQDPCFQFGGEELAVEEFIAQPAVERLAVGILPWASGFDEQRSDPADAQPVPNLMCQELWPVVATQMKGHTSLPNEPTQHSDHVGSRQLPPDFQGKAFAREFVHHDQDLQSPAVHRPILNEVVAPHLVWAAGSQALAPMAFQAQAPPLVRSLRYPQPFLSPEPLNAFVVDPPTRPAEASCRHAISRPR